MKGLGVEEQHDLSLKHPADGGVHLWTHHHHALGGGNRPLRPCALSAGREKKKDAEKSHSPDLAQQRPVEVAQGERGGLAGPQHSAGRAVPLDTADGQLVELARVGGPDHQAVALATNTAAAAAEREGELRGRRS